MTEAPFVPDWISPPGDTIADLLEERGWSPGDLAERAGFTIEHVSDLLDGRASITPDAAERLAHVLGGSSDFWLVREVRYRQGLTPAPR